VSSCAYTEGLGTECDLRFCTKGERLSLGGEDEDKGEGEGETVSAGTGMGREREFGR
jgi:hypothetical protein